jgi:hypothetical protein
MASKWLKYCILMPIAVLAAPAMAEQPYYFHKTGISRDAYMDDVNDCAELAGGARVERYNIYAANPAAAANPYAVGISSFFIGFMEARQRRRLVSRIERTCMADKGYKRLEIEKKVLSDIRKLEDQAKLERLFALASAENPVGREMIE